MFSIGAAHYKDAVNAMQQTHFSVPATASQA